MGEVVVRDYIPQDAEMTAEEQARFASDRPGIPAGTTFVSRDYVPQEETPPDRTDDEKRTLAEELAARAEATAKADHQSAAEDHLKRIDAQEAIAFIGSQPDYLQEVYLRAEARSDRPRRQVLDAFPGFRLPDSKEKDGEDSDGKSDGGPGLPVGRAAATGGGGDDDVTVKEPSIEEVSAPLVEAGIIDHVGRKLPSEDSQPGPPADNDSLPEELEGTESLPDDGESDEAASEYESEDRRDGETPTGASTDEDPED